MQNNTIAIIKSTFNAQVTSGAVALDDFVGNAIDKVEAIENTAVVGSATADDLAQSAVDTAADLILWAAPKVFAAFLVTLRLAVIFYSVIGRNAYNLGVMAASRYNQSNAPYTLVIKAAVTNKATTIQNKVLGRVERLQQYGVAQVAKFDNWVSQGIGHAASRLMEGGGDR